MKKKASPPRRRVISTKTKLVVQVGGAPSTLGRDLRRAARVALEAEGIKHGRLEIAVVDAKQMAQAHFRWMKIRGPTDVLTFDLRDDDERKKTDVVAGQLLVCGDIARSSAERAGVRWQAELALYVVHGCLHLCGYDDHRARDAAKMHRREDELLTRLGWGAVFGAATSKSRRPGKA